jgi:hypothetical protein
MSQNAPWPAKARVARSLFIGHKHFFWLTTRNLLIEDEKFPSQINKKPSLYIICDGFRERHWLTPVTIYRKPSQMNGIGDGFKPSQ